MAENPDRTRQLARPRERWFTSGKRSGPPPGVVLAAAAAILGAACAPPPAAEPEPRGLDLRGATVVDLSHSYDDATLYWPTETTRFELSQLAHGMTDGGYFYAANAFCAPEHGGTHIDAPIHFAQQGWTLGEVPVERLIAPGVVIDVSAAAARDPDYRLTAEDVLAWEQARGEAPAGAIVLLRTGWSSRWPDALDYLGDDTPGDASNLHFPAYGAEAARLLVEQRRVAALGVDTASIDHGPSADFIVHRIAAAANVVGLENLTNLDQIPSTGAWIAALPMNIAKGSGGPVRVVALHK